MKLKKQYYKKTTNRAIRIAQELKKEISIILQKYLNDPRINFTITISTVKLSKDLSIAKIFISYLDYYSSSVNHFNNLYDLKNIMIILKKASGYIRKILCKKIFLRKIPILNFYHDDSLTNGIKISNLLKTI